MEAMNTWQDEVTAETVINSSVAKGGSGKEILDRIQTTSEIVLASSEQANVEYFVHNIQEQTKGTIVTTMDEGVGGSWDGSKIRMATGTWYADASVEETIDRVTEIRDHENYHKEHDHTAPLTVIEDTRYGATTVIGQKKFDTEKLVEAVDVTATGDQFVSEEYRQHKADLKQAMSNAHLTFEEVAHAVNVEKNTASIDDRSEQPETSYALAS